VVIFGGIAVAGFVGAGVAFVVKQQAQNSANTVAQQITSYATAHGTATKGLCNSPNMVYQAPCNELATDNNDVNQDATAGNVALGVGVAGLVGGLAYWMFADKKHVTVTGATSPWFRGLVVSGEF
jgi:hypothetical protein